MNKIIKYVLIIGSILFILSLFINLRQYEKIKELKNNKINSGFIIKSNKILIDSLKKDNVKIEEDRNKLLKSFKNDTNNVKIITKYKTIYETIKNSNDSIQYNILFNLLKRSKEISFKRD